MEKGERRVSTFFMLLRSPLYFLLSHPAALLTSDLPFAIRHLQLQNVLCFVRVSRFLTGAAR